jgi:uncharacterized membrane protein
MYAVWEGFLLAAVALSLMIGLIRQGRKLAGLEKEMDRLQHAVRRLNSLLNVPQSAAGPGRDSPQESAPLPRSGAASAEPAAPSAGPENAPPHTVFDQLLREYDAAYTKGTNAETLSRLLDNLEENAPGELPHLAVLNRRYALAQWGNAAARSAYQAAAERVAAQFPHSQQVAAIVAEEAAELTASLPASASFAQADRAPGYPGFGGPAWLKKLAGLLTAAGLWAAGGVIFLLIAVALLFTYMAQRGFMTVEIRIACAALLGLLLLFLGWRLRKKRRSYSLILQGGGIGVLYLCVYAAHRLTPYVPAPVAVLLMSILAPSAVAIALTQRAELLAVFGFLSGFAAPIMLFGPDRDHLFFFAYYAVLSAAVFVITFFHSWRILNILAFICTFAYSLIWTLACYEPSLFPSIEPFVLGFIALYTAIGLHAGSSFPVAKDRTTVTGTGAAKSRVNAPVLAGVPIAAAALQWRLFSFIPHGLAIVSLAGGAFYLTLALILWKRGKADFRVFTEAYLALSVILANLAIPLELSGAATNAVWAVEALAVFFVGCRAAPALRFRIKIAALAMYIAAVFDFFIETAAVFLRSAVPFARNPAFIGALLISLSGAGIALLAYRRDREASAKTKSVFTGNVGLVMWSLLWWFCAWGFEIVRVGNDPAAAGFSFFAFCSVSAVIAFSAASLLRFPWLKAGVIPALVVAVVFVLGVFLSRFRWSVDVWTHNFFTVNDAGAEKLPPWLCWLLFFVSQGGLLFASNLKQVSGGEVSEKAARTYVPWFLIFLFTSIAVVSASGRAAAVSWGLAHSWVSFTGMLPVFAAFIWLALGIPSGQSMPGSNAAASGRGTSRFVPGGGSINRAGIAILAFVFCLWFLVTLFLSGDPAPLPVYIPVLNPLELQQAFCILLVLWLWLRIRRNRTAGESGGVLSGVFLPVAADVMGFLWLTSICARSVHFMGGLPFFRVGSSDIFHLCLFIVWALYGAAHTVFGHKKTHRPVWIAGAVLILADLVKLLSTSLTENATLTKIVSFFIAGILLIIIGWVSPMPPAHKAHSAAPEETRP